MATGRRKTVLPIPEGAGRITGAALQHALHPDASSADRNRTAGDATLDALGMGGHRFDPEVLGTPVEHVPVPPDDPAST